VKLVIYLVLPEPRTGWSKAAAQRLGQVVRGACTKLSIPCTNVVPLCNGHAGGFAALSQAAELLSSRSSC
jgi:hypothetical protein